MQLIQEQGKRCRFDLIGWAAEYLLLTGAEAFAELLSFPPHLFHFSLDDLVPLDSSNGTMSTPGLVRTPVQRKRVFRRTPNLKSSTSASSPVAGFQKYATLSADKTADWNIFKYWDVAFLLGQEVLNQQMVYITPPWPNG